LLAACNAGVRARDRRLVRQQLLCWTRGVTELDRGLFAALASSARLSCSSCRRGWPTCGRLARLRPSLSRVCTGRS
jgi:hypothetical protein